MKFENSPGEFSWKTTLQKTQSKVSEIWKFDLRILLKNKFTKDGIKLNEIGKFDQRILLKDNFTEHAIEIKWNLIIRPENSVERQLYRRRNENWMKSENSTREFCRKTTLQKTKLKLNEIWKFDLRILLKDHFTEDTIEIKWYLKLRHENSVERQL